MAQNSIDQKRNIAANVVHDVATSCAKQIHEAVLKMEGFDDSEKFMTEQRIVNRIYVAFNNIAFRAASESLKAGDL